MILYGHVLGLWDMFMLQSALQSVNLLIFVATLCAPACCHHILGKLVHRISRRGCNALIGQRC
jgi:hypothetical protein